VSKERLLDDWARRVATAATQEMLGKRINVTYIETVAGPRAGALHILAGMDADRLLSTLSRQNNALLRQMVPWDFVGDPAAYMYGRYVRLEAGWDDSNANTDIPLSSISQMSHKPIADGKWIAGLDEGGRIIIPSLNRSQTPHWLFCGTTGSGKTVALWSAIQQLGADPKNRLVLIDGKKGASFRHENRQMFHLRQQVGPVATTAEEWRGALVWTVREMDQRYANGYDGRLIIVIDEVQEVIIDPVAAEAWRRLIVMGRDGGVHGMGATQYPVVDALGGPTVVRDMDGRFVLRVTDPTAARVALGQESATLPAHKLLGRGDAITKTPEHAYRIQTAYVTDRDLSRVSGGEFELDKWPEATAEDLGMEVKRRGRNSPWPKADEMGAALVAAKEGKGRDLFHEMIRGEDPNKSVPGGGRSTRLQNLGGEVHMWLKEHDYRLANVHTVESEPEPEQEQAPQIVDVIPSDGGNELSVCPKIGYTPPSTPYAPPMWL